MLRENVENTKEKSEGKEMKHRKGRKVNKRIVRKRCNEKEVRSKRKR